MHPKRPVTKARRGGWAPVVAAALALVVAAACGGSSPGDGPAATATTVTRDPGTTGGGPPSSAVASSGFGPAVERGLVSDEDVTESSGLVASRRHPGRLWTHNDSGHPPVLFCVEPDGGSCGRWNVDGADNLDWEDIAAGPGPTAGEHYLYVGDIGDNDRSRDEVVVYRVVEPTVPDGGRGGGVTDQATALRFRYDDGPHDAESLMVHPDTGDVYVVIKAAGDTGVYRGLSEGGVLTRVATLGLGPLGVVTGGDISPDGRQVALCTPFAGYEFTLAHGAAEPFDAIWKRPPGAVALPPREQGESIAYRLDGNALLLTSEGQPSPLFEVPRR
jgi:hypothetical protein